MQEHYEIVKYIIDKYFNAEERDRLWNYLMKEIDILDLGRNDNR